jgi:hypothetical protein
MSPSEYSIDFDVWFTRNSHASSSDFHVARLDYLKLKLKKHLHFQSNPLAGRLPKK